MREIKFRAWDKIEKIMYLDVQDEYDFICGSKIAESFGELLEDEDFIVMQFTGLKDKNGKEIFEGDILFDGTVKSFVIWKEEESMFGINNGKYELGYYNNWEVIGNIYENPELLEEEK